MASPHAEVNDAGQANEVDENPEQPQTVESTPVPPAKKVSTSLVEALKEEFGGQGGDSPKGPADKKSVLKDLRHQLARASFFGNSTQVKQLQQAIQHAEEEAELVLGLEQREQEKHRRAHDVWHERNMKLLAGVKCGDFSLETMKAFQRLSPEDGLSAIADYYKTGKHLERRKLMDIVKEEADVGDDFYHNPNADVSVADILDAYNLHDDATGMALTKLAAMQSAGGPNNRPGSGGTRVTGSSYTGYYKNLRAKAVADFHNNRPKTPPLIRAEKRALIEEEYQKYLAAQASTPEVKVQGGAWVPFDLNALGGKRTPGEDGGVFAAKLRKRKATDDFGPTNPALSNNSKSTTGGKKLSFKPSVPFKPSSDRLKSQSKSTRGGDTRGGVSSSGEPRHSQSAVNGQEESVRSSSSSGEKANGGGESEDPEFIIMHFTSEKAFPAPLFGQALRWYGAIHEVTIEREEHSSSLPSSSPHLTATTGMVNLPGGETSRSEGVKSPVVSALEGPPASLANKGKNPHDSADHKSGTVRFAPVPPAGAEPLAPQATTTTATSEFITAPLKNPFTWSPVGKKDPYTTLAAGDMKFKGSRGIIKFRTLGLRGRQLPSVAIETAAVKLWVELPGGRDAQSLQNVPEAADSQAPTSLRLAGALQKKHQQMSGAVKGKPPSNEGKRRSTFWNKKYTAPKPGMLSRMRAGGDSPRAKHGVGGMNPARDPDLEGSGALSEESEGSGRAGASASQHGTKIKKYSLVNINDMSPRDRLQFLVERDLAYEEERQQKRKSNTRSMYAMPPPPERIYAPPPAVIPPLFSLDVETAQCLKKKQQFEDEEEQIQKPKTKIQEKRADDSAKRDRVEELRRKRILDRGKSLSARATLQKNELHQDYRGTLHSSRVSQPSISDRFSPSRSRNGSPHRRATEESVARSHRLAGTAGSQQDNTTFPLIKNPRPHDGGDWGGRKLAERTDVPGFWSAKSRSADIGSGQHEEYHYSTSTGTLLPKRPFHGINSAPVGNVDLSLATNKLHAFPVQTVQPQCVGKQMAAPIRTRVV